MKSGVAKLPAVPARDPGDALCSILGEKLETMLDTTAVHEKRIT